jgi:excisionase family DNA binding protein
MPYSRSSDVGSEWMKASEIAAILDVHPRTVVRMIRRGELQVRAIEFGKAVRVHRGDWKAELERRQIVAASA